MSSNRLLLGLIIVCIAIVVVLNLGTLQSLGTSFPSGNAKYPDLPLPTNNHNHRVKRKPSNKQKKAVNPPDSHHTLNCEKHGGPSQEVAAEMVYWRDIPSDADFTSPFARTGPNENPKYLTFEPDEGGWNNIRMSMETAVTLAHAMGRILVLPPPQGMYLLNKDKNLKNRFTFNDFFPFDEIQTHHTAVQIISFEEFLNREAMTGGLLDKTTGQPSFPPANKTDWSSNKKARGNPIWLWMRSVSENPTWFFDDCMAAFPKTTNDTSKLNDYLKQFKQDPTPPQKRMASYVNNPTPVDAPPQDRLREMMGHRKTLCVYDQSKQNAKVFHLMGDNASGARLLVHFYLFLFFEDYHQDLWTKRFVRDHLRYIDEIQCAAARVVKAMRMLAKDNGNAAGEFDTFHIRRGDFQYKSTRVEAPTIYENIRDVIPENTTVFIATDERLKNFFDPLKQHYHIYFLDDFMHLLQGLNKNYYGMVDQRVASRGRTFCGAFFSTFTGYINRMRGYHSQKDQSEGYQEGQINSYYYIERKHKHEVRHYVSVLPPMWAREFPVGWRDIDHDILQDKNLS